MKTSFVERIDCLSEGDRIVYAEDEGDKELLKNIYFTVVWEYLQVDLDEIKPYVKTDLDIALKKDGRDAEFIYKKTFPDSPDYEALSVVLSLAELITNAKEIKYGFKGRRKLYISMRTEKGRVIFETFSEKTNISFNMDISEDGKERDSFMEYGFKVRRV